MKKSFSVMFAIVLCACKPAALPDNQQAGAAVSNSVDMTDMENYANSQPTPPTPNYDEHEGDRYMYVSAVSEDDKKKGRAVGNVIQYRYLGEKDGLYALAFVDDSGRELDREECRNPCRVIKTTTAGRVGYVPYDRSSIIGAAFEDAFNGFLKTARSADAASSSPAAGSLQLIPAAFAGEWNDDLASCGTVNDESALTVTPTEVRFMESTGIVKSIDVLGPNSINVHTKANGEDGRSENTFTMTLRNNGSELLIGEETIPHKRCRG